MERVEIFVVDCSILPTEAIKSLPAKVLSQSDPLIRLGPSNNPVFENYKSKVWFLSTENGAVDGSFSGTFSFSSVWNNLKKAAKPLSTFGILSHGFKRIFGTLNHPGKTIVNVHVWKWQNERENRELSDSLSSFVQIYCAKVMFYSEDCQVYLIPPEIPSSVIILPAETYDPQNPAWRGQVALYSETGRSYELVKHLEMSLWNGDLITGPVNGEEDQEPLFFGDKLEVINQCEFRTIPGSLFSGQIYCLSTSCDIKSRHAADAWDFFALANANPNKSFIFRLIYSLDLPLSWRENLQALRSVGRITRHVSFASFPLVENGNRRLLLFGLNNVEDLDVEQEEGKASCPQKDFKELGLNSTSANDLPNLPIETLLRLVQLRKNTDNIHSALFFEVLRSRSSDFGTAPTEALLDGLREQRASWPSCEILERRNRQMSQLYSYTSQGDSRVYAISTAEVVRIFKDPKSPSKPKASPRKTPVKHANATGRPNLVEWPEVYQKKSKSVGISYNFGRDSEQKEADTWRLQEKLEAHETESSCNPLDSGFRCFVLRRNREANTAENPESIAKQKVNPNPDSDKKPTFKKTGSPLVLRRSPRKRRLSGNEEPFPHPPRKRTTDSGKESSKDPRAAEKNSQLKEDFPRVIYKCLKPRGITTKDPLYLQVGNQLYVVLKGFVRENKHGDTSAQKLLEVCEKNVDSILEQCRR